MRAAEHTARMLDWWHLHQIDRVDLAIKRGHQAPCWHYGLDLERIPLSWARYENAQGADIYIRAQRQGAWPMLFFDDVPMAVGREVAGQFDCLVVRTSVAGGCHLWLATSTALDENRRAEAQRRLATELHADPRSCSGEHLGRLAGFRNVKAGGEWVNVEIVSPLTRRWRGRPMSMTTPHGPSETAGRSAVIEHPQWSTCRDSVHAASATVGGRDHSESGKEWGWVCGALKAGMSPEWIEHRLWQRARQRRGRDAKRYARLTVRNALKKLRRH